MYEVMSAWRNQARRQKSPSSSSMDSQVKAAVALS
jgi:hypothetical protein